MVDTAVRSAGLFRGDAQSWTSLKAHYGTAVTKDRIGAEILAVIQRPAEQALVAFQAPGFRRRRIVFSGSTTSQLAPRANSWRVCANLGDASFKARVVYATRAFWRCARQGAPAWRWKSSTGPARGTVSRRQGFRGRLRV